MLTDEENELLTRVGPGTPGGELLRRYWHPVCAADQLAANPLRTREVRLLGEDLVVYRDRSGHLGVVDRYCPHRRASLAYGVVEADGIRCQYHGWKFDAAGTCVEQPFEDVVQPSGRFRERCPVRAYRAEELGGLIFVYMGPDPAPLLPRWGILVWDDSVRDLCITHLPCNWLQAQENSLDSIHTEHLHDYANRYFTQVLAGEEPDFRRERFHTDIDFDVYPYGIIKRRTTDDRGKDHPRWAIGHSVLFPNILWHNATMQWRTPVDDTHTDHFSMYLWRAAPGKHAPAQETIPSREIQLYENNGSFAGLTTLFNQDYMCWVTQGEIADRQVEKLGRSDRGVQLYRKMLREQIDLVASGAEPSINVFRDPSDNEGLEWPRIPYESKELVGGPGKPPKDGTWRYEPMETGYSRDADKIEATMATWREFYEEPQAVPAYAKSEWGILR